MRKNFSEPKFVVRVILGTLLVANLIAAAMVLFPPGGSAEDLERELANLQSQIAQKKALLERTREHTAAVEKGRSEGDNFLKKYFLDRRTAYSTLDVTLAEAAEASKIKPREGGFSEEPIEGSDTLKMVSVTVTFEGANRDVLTFLHEIDRSPRLLIIESLNATPQQGSNSLTVSMKLDAFVREEQL